MEELSQKLAAMGAGSFRMRQIRDAVMRLRNEGDPTTVVADSVEEGSVATFVQPSSSAVAQLGQTKKRYAVRG